MSEVFTHAGAILTVDLDAVCDNYLMLRNAVRRTGRSTICSAVLKADAYGLGAGPVAKALATEGCRHFFVAHLDEGIQLRQHVPHSSEIFVLHGPLSGSEMEFVKHRLIPVLNSAPQVAGWRFTAWQLNCSLPAIVQVDTGMSRLGLSVSEVQMWHRDKDFLRGIELRYVMSHLACAEDQTNPANEKQLAAFNDIRSGLPAFKASFANSSGIFLGEDFHFDLVRPGAALYGIAPVFGEPNPMKAVVRLQAKVIQLREIGPGDAVGYGLTYRASQRRRIATISVGYADGWLRSFSNKGSMQIGSKWAPIVGIVSMDTCAVDVTDIPLEEISSGGMVDLLSPAHTVDDAAREAGTIGYEILTSLGQRYHRHYVGRRTEADDVHSLASASA